MAQEIQHKYTNHLITESSPYLLQHAHNPVDWYPWGEEALNKAKAENKLLIVSIGYAACHWCHVMEHESFEDEEVADFMNEHYVSVKVDREERPDIDQVYMHAVQLITRHGGWPLNCIALPDGRPVYGGTYYPKAQWMDLITGVLTFAAQNADKTEQQANYIVQGIKSGELIYSDSPASVFTPRDLDMVFDIWKENIDLLNGGNKGAPKFPMPSNYQFLLFYHYLSGKTEPLQAVLTTLEKMAGGGIYDQVGGGFSRYSTDVLWKVPHFEKMLYDNAQLVSLYSSAFQLTKDEKYKIIVTETLEFIGRELTSSEGGFYSSLDADSEGEEGKFYVWSFNELKEVLGERTQIIMEYYNASEIGNWEKGRNILFKTKTDREIAEKHKLTLDELTSDILEAKKLLLHERSKRIRPGLDDKILTSWNALMIKAYVDAYRVFNIDEYLVTAIKHAMFIVLRLQTEGNRLYRNYKNGKASINAFLDDYAFTISAFIALYQATFDEEWLMKAQHLTVYAMDHFYDRDSGMFYYTSDIDPPLIARKMELSDNVTPSSNSEMAKNLYLLGHYFYNEEYIRKSIRMLNNVRLNLMDAAVYYANWDYLLCWYSSGPYETAIVGNEFESRRKEFEMHYLPDVFLSGGIKEGSLPLLEGKSKEETTAIYVCKNRVCLLPVFEVPDALKLILH